jgi:hypothetical protein
MSHIRRMAYFLMLLVGAALLTAMVWRPAPPKSFVGLQTNDIPRQVAEYVAPADEEVTPETRAALPDSDIISRQYTKGGDQVEFLLVGGTTREALHDPRSCMTGAGLSLANDHTEVLPGTTTEIHSCQVLGMPGTPSFDALYLYIVGGRRISSVSQIRREMLVNALIGRQNEPVYLLRFMQPQSSDPQAQVASHARMMAFAAQMWTTLKPQLDKG